ATLQTPEAPYPPEARALFADAWEHPEDDTPRLVLADWLVENGPPDRAALLHVEGARARLGPADPRRAELGAQGGRLQEALEQAGRAALGAGAECAWTFDRGLVDAITMEARTFLARGEAVCDRTQPRRLHLYGAPRGIDDRRDLSALVASPYLSRVHTLDLQDNYLGPADVALLAGSPRLDGVAVLRLQGNAL